MELSMWSNFEPIPRQNLCDGDKVDVDLYHVRWAYLLRLNPESRVVSFVGCRIASGTP
jgi:hypothetical protein